MDNFAKSVIKFDLLLRNNLSTTDFEAIRPEARKPICSALSFLVIVSLLEGAAVGVSELKNNSDYVTDAVGKWNTFARRYGDPKLNRLFVQIERNLSKTRKEKQHEKTGFDEIGDQIADEFNREENDDEESDYDAGDDQDC